MQSDTQPALDDDFVVSEGADFVPPPADMHHAVCVDLYKKMVRNPFKLDGNGQPTSEERWIVAWELEALMDDGRRFTAYKSYTPSLHARSNMRADLIGWRGRDFSPEELKGFQLSQIIGAPCRLVIAHKPRNDGSINARVTTVLRADPNHKLAPSGKFVRHKDRQHLLTRPTGELPGAVE